MISLLTQCLSHALLYLSFIYLFYSLLFNFSFHLHSQLPLLSFLSFFFLHAFPYISIHNKGATVPRATNFLPSFFIKHLSLSLSSPGLIPAVDKTMLAHLGSRWRRQLLRNYLGNYANSELRGGKSASCLRECGERDTLPACGPPPGHGPAKMCLIRAQRHCVMFKLTSHQVTNRCWTGERGGGCYDLQLWWYILQHFDIILMI